MIVAVTMVALTIAMSVQTPLYALLRDTAVPVLLRLGLVGAFQFGIAGLGITLVALFRKESFLKHGLKKTNLLKAVVLSFLCFIPHLIFMIVTKEASSYLPFQEVMTTKDVLASGFITSVIGMVFTALIWGFFEGFNYVFICDKINILLPTKNKYLDWGALICAGFCILVHGAIGVTLNGLIEMATIVFLIYGMLVVRKQTNNAWGCVFVFIFLWNAF